MRTGKDIWADMVKTFNLLGMYIVTAQYDKMIAAARDLARYATELADTAEATP